MYRQLRKEGIAFPARDPNIRMYMESMCEDSPMFDFVEQSVGREVNPRQARLFKEQAEKEQEKEENVEQKIKELL